MDRIDTLSQKTVFEYTCLSIVFQGPMFIIATYTPEV